MDGRDRLTELLAERATQGLDAGDSAELDLLLTRHPRWNDDTFDLAAAAIDRALAGEPDPLPDHLRARLLDTAAGFTASRWTSSREPAAETTGGERPLPRPAATRPRRRALVAWGGWLAAAAVTVAALALWPVNRPPRGESVRTTAATEQRRQLMAEADDLLRVEWRATEDPAAVAAGGDVVWSASRQRGYLRIHGLRANDPRRFQYQLWVFDAARDERFPVDGGVFDIPAGEAEAVIPIHTAIPVSEAALFAVTVERPGGVVVSERERIVLLAAASAR